MKAVRIFFFAFLVLVVYLVFDILISSGAFKKIEPHFAGSISMQELPVAGPEDITIDTQTGIAFISVDDRRTNQNNPGTIEGAILVMNLSDSVPVLRDVSKNTLNDFHPHGISLWKGNGKTFLFVVNHGQKIKQHTIERFEWRNDSLIYLETIVDANLMTSPNDVTAVGEREFYVTNDHGYSERGIGRTLEDYLQLRLSYVNYYNGMKFQKVAEDIAYANGINHSADNSKIFVASPTGGKVFVYNRNSTDGTLTLAEEVDVNTGVDNIEVDGSGALWIGCHPQLLKFVAHAANANKFSPSQIIKLSPEGPTGYRMEEIFLNDGTEYSGSTVAAVYGNKMLVGSVFEKTMLICTLNSTR